MPTVILGPPNRDVYEPGSHRVYLRETWAGAWAEVDNVHCEEAVWCASPSIPTATLVFFYGEIANHRQSFSLVSKLLSRERWYVKIEFDMQPTDNDPAIPYATRTWYGTLEVDQDDLWGAQWARNTPIGSGQQTFTAYGLEKLLADQYVESMRVEGGLTIKRAADFNRGGRANMSAAPEGNTFVFSSDASTATHWGTTQIVDYLLEHQTPRDRGGTENVPFQMALGNLFPLPLFDQPSMPAQGRTVLSLLEQLIPAERLYSFRIQPDILGNAEIHVFTLTPNAVLAPQGATISDIPANTDVIDLVMERDVTASATAKISTAEVFDQVVVLGARRRSVCSLSFPDATLTIGWDSSLTTPYNQGASTASDYPSAGDILGRRKRDAEARSRQELANVFSRFAIVGDWDGKAGRGEGDTGALKPVFLKDDPASPDSEPHYELELTIEQSMPLLEGVDYSGTKIEDETVDEGTATVERAPLVSWYLPPEDPTNAPSTRRWQDISTIGRSGHLQDVQDQDLTWSADVSVPPESPAIDIRVGGRPQHVIASADFSALGHDQPIASPSTYREMIVTCSVRDDRFATGIWPSQVPANNAPDLVRRLVIDAGDDYRLDYVVPGTVVDIDTSGALVRTTGGFVHDDRPVLLGFARVAHAWYSRPRKTLSFETDYLTTEIEIGQLIDRVNTKRPNDDVDNFHRIQSVVTEIRITTPIGEGDAIPAAPRMRVSTHHGQLAPLSFRVDPQLAQSAAAIEYAPAFPGKQS